MNMNNDFLKLLDKDQIVIRNRLDEEINKLMMFNKILYVYARIGWGKTTTIIYYASNYLENSTYHKFRIEDNNTRSFLILLIEIISSIEKDINKDKYYNIVDKINFFTNENIWNINNIEEEIKRFINKLVLCLKGNGIKKTIILDDLNMISNNFVKKLLVHFISISPSNYKFIISSTREVPTCFSEFIINREIDTLNSEKLAFNKKEINEFFIKEGIYLEDFEIDEIFLNTFGWPAGMSSILIYLKLDRDRNIKKIFENNDYINDFFNNNIWTTLDERTKKFFMKISLFKGLHIEQCIEITGESKSKELIESITKIKEDGTYELVPIFWDFIKLKSKKLSSEEKIELYTRAGESFEKRNLNLEAAEYYSKAGDSKSEIRNLEKFCSKRKIYMDLSQMEKYIRKIPKDIVLKNPTLCTVMAILEITSYRPQKGEKWYKTLLDIKENMSKERDNIIEKKDKLTIELKKIGNTQIVISNKYERLFKLEKEINNCKNEISKYNEYISKINSNISYVYFMLPQTSNEKIIEEFNNTYKTGNYNGKALENISITLNFPSMICGVKDVSKIWNNYELMGKDVQERITAVYGVYGIEMDKIASAEVDYEKNDINNSLLKLTNAISNCTINGHVDTLFVAYIVLYKFICASGYISEAKRILNEIKNIIEEKDTLYLMRNLNAVYARFYLLNGDIKSAKECTSKHINTKMNFNLLKTYEYLTEARIYISQKEYKIAYSYLEILYRLNSEYKRTRTVIECCILQAIALNRDGDDELALIKISEALEMAEPLNYIRVFADEGEACHEILNKYLKNTKISKKVSSDYLKKVLLETRKFAQMYPKYFKAEEDICKINLTKSEVQILRLIYKGMSNVEISDYLNIKKDTVKFHVKNIYSKLNVNNRIQAAKLANEFGIIEEKQIN